MASSNVLVFGIPESGKSSLIKRYIDQTFCGEFPPCMDATVNVTAKVGDKTVELAITEMIEPDYEAMWKLTIKNGHAFMFVYSVANRASFDALETLYKDVTEIKNMVVPMVVCGNKCDLESERQVPTSDGEAFAVRIGATFFETSALADTNVSEAFMAIASSITPPEQQKHKQKGKCIVS